MPALAVERDTACEVDEAGVQRRMMPSFDECVACTRHSCVVSSILRVLHLTREEERG